MANIVVASYDKKLREFLSSRIVGEKINKAYNLMESTPFFRPNEFNILIFDLDSGASSRNYMSMITARFNLLVILTGSDTKKAMDCIAVGYKDFIIKPTDYHDAYADEYVTSIVQRIKDEGEKNGTAKHLSRSSQRTYGRMSASALIRQSMAGYSYAAKNEMIICIASSTGGPDALVEVLSRLPEDTPPVLVVQHFPPNFTLPYVKRISKFCKMNITVAAPFEYIERGTVYFAEAGTHMYLVKSGGRLAVESRKGKKINGVMPAADELFDSVAEIVRKNAIGVVMTGMGSDGAKGLYAMRKTGAHTIGQNQETCVVYGMPMAARNIGAVEYELPLSSIGEKIKMLAK